MRSATTTRMITYGVKGVSPLAASPEFSICKGMVIEAMHAVFLGVVKQHLNLLLTSFGAPYYIGSPNNKVVIDARLMAIKPPNHRSRLPRSIKTCGQWKASEFKNWLEYAPVCLDGVGG
ncbi:hypothetical protein PV328_007704 [Microctonus aethiopoides]|uniref:Uncharacterized protein n=1 Tax=Microctonus aethiopoides TaxID=144406 RepID=A0AA39F0T1_9HYME|nr:hypothetical protein PV328_007704 [Microctonus aethiopoides]